VLGDKVWGVGAWFLYLELDFGIWGISFGVGVEGVGCGGLVSVFGVAVEMKRDHNRGESALIY
jgi:hypothetical protein